MTQTQGGGLAMEFLIYILNQLRLNLILFPYLASKFPVAVATKKESRLDQGEEGQGIVFFS